MSENKNFPRIIIGAPGSGSGKTLITCAILRILEKKGYKPISYKCGPDYIDPMFHRTVLGIPSRNLDLFLQKENGVKSALIKGSAGRDIGIIEGVMGFYDGVSATSMEGSTYHISRVTGTPAMLLVNCKGMSRSILPMLKGYAEYGEEKAIRGFFLNNISDHLAAELSPLIFEETGIPVVGHLPHLKDNELQSRHLGRVMPSEIPGILSLIDGVSTELEPRIDIELLMNIAETAGEIEAEPEKTCSQSFNVKVAVARDEAFCFYYEDNLELLKEMGAEIIPFSPIHDEKLPEADRLILGGGYPELYAKELSENETMLESIRKAIDRGMPTLAECGGFLYLKETLTGSDNKKYKMAGVLKGDAFMTGKLSHFGYVNVTAVEDSPYLKKGETILGHEYHYYDTTDNGQVCEIKKQNGKNKWDGIQVKSGLFAGFAHLYYPSLREFIQRFLK